MSSDFFTHSIHGEPMPPALERLQQFMARYGYARLQTPIIEPSALFLTKAGDQVIDRLLTFTRAGREFALRPEFTASAMAQYAASGEPIVRWQFSGTVFQDVADQPFHYETVSAGAELIGYAGPHADAEIIAMAALGLEELGISDSQVIIGHVGLTRHLVERFALDERTTSFLMTQRELLRQADGGREQFTERLNQYLPFKTPGDAVNTELLNDPVQAEQILEALLKSGNRGTALGGRTREEIAQRLIKKGQWTAQRSVIEAAVDFLQEWSLIRGTPEAAFTEMRRLAADADCIRMLDRWAQVIDLVLAYGIAEERIVIQPDLARTWDYYTGAVFELVSESGQDLGGGGRYDELGRLIGAAQATPAVGFAYYEAALQSGAVNVHVPTPWVIVDAGDNPSAIHWLQALRRQGLEVIVLPEAGNTPSERLLINHAENDTLQYEHQTFTPDELGALMNRLDA
jgi:histidyl-tRNA synthetase